MVGFRKSRMTTSNGWRELLASQQLDSVSAVYQSTQGISITQSRTSEVRRLELSQHNLGQVIYLKKYWFPTVRHRLKGAFRGAFFGSTKVKREYENLRCLRSLGFDAPAPVAYGEERRWGWLIRSFLISAGITDPCPLDVFIRDQLSRLPPDLQSTARCQLIEKLARYTRRIHDHHFVHHDYFWRNIILSQGSLARFFLIDAHKGRFWHACFGWRLRARDLAALDAPAPAFFRRTDRLRFFLRYCGHRHLTRRDKTVVSWILRWAAPLRSRQLERVQKASYTAGGSPPARIPQRGVP